MQQDYLAGVVEGFYGQTWTQPQRRRLFENMSEWGLNTYFYSPKDDLKHRAIWRELYDDGELSELSELIDACGKHGLQFFYGLSPGLDIRFSDPAELEAIKQRFRQLIDVGARHFALLFDDLPGNMTDEDVAAFGSLAEAQSSVTNAVFTWLREQFPESRLLFCPTPYCDRMDRWNLGGEDYLDQIGQHLAADIDVLWTGPEIVSRDISAESIQDLSARIGREPVIWDNLHANDYDLRRVFCGPYCGRPPETLKQVRGVLTNPNNEFGINYVPLKTMADCLKDPESYEPRESYVAAVQDWLEGYESVRAPLAEEDLRLLADCYYLPFEDGDSAIALQELVDRLIHRQPEEWGDDFDTFLDYHRRISTVFETLTELKDRDLFYAWSRRIWELREEMGLLKGFLECRRSGEDETNGFALETHLLHTCRGGLVARLQQHTTLDDNGRFHVQRCS